MQWLGKHQEEEDNMSRQVHFTFNGQEYKIDYILAYQLDSIVYNLGNDWDFVLLVTGDRMVRVGKSVLAMIIAAYLGWSLATYKKDGKPLNTNAYNMSNLFFDNKIMVDEAQKRPPYSIIHYDEAREGLAASKAMQQFQKDLIDFFNECGQLNHVFIIVCPDFFTLKEDIAVARSELLINVYRKELRREVDLYKTGEKRPITYLQRGHFELFSRKSKQLLYEIAKSTSRKSYGHVKADHVGDYSHQYPINEEEYRKAKREALGRFKERHAEVNSNRENKAMGLRDRLIRDWSASGMKRNDIKALLEQKYEYGISLTQIGRLINENKPDSEFKLPN